MGPSGLKKPRPELLVFLMEAGRRDMVATILNKVYTQSAVIDEETEKDIDGLCCVFNTPLSNGQTFLSLFVERLAEDEKVDEYRSALEIMLECGADPDMIIPATGQRPGHVVAAHNSIWAAKLLLLAGMDVTLKSHDEKPMSVLSKAAKEDVKFAEMIKTWVGLPMTFGHFLSHRRYLGVFNLVRRGRVKREDLFCKINGTRAYEVVYQYNIARLVSEMEYRYKHILGDIITNRPQQLPPQAPDLMGLSFLNTSPTVRHQGVNTGSFSTEGTPNTWRSQSSLLGIPPIRGPNTNAGPGLLGIPPRPSLLGPFPAVAPQAPFMPWIPQSQMSPVFTPGNAGPVAARPLLMPRPAARFRPDAGCPRNPAPGLLGSPPVTYPPQHQVSPACTCPQCLAFVQPAYALARAKYPL